jgi:hypothetical protein
MNKLFLRIAFMAAFATALSSSQANAQTFINYQASIQKPDNMNKLIPIPDGSYDVTVFIYQDTIINSKPVYAESHSNIPVKNGLVNLKIGKGSPSIFALNATFETIKWNSEKPFYVRINFPTLSINGSYQQLGSVPYALSAGSADWKNIGDTAIYTTKKYIGIGTNTPSTNLNIYPKGEGGILLGNPKTGMGGFTSLYMGITADTSGKAYLQSIKKSGSDWGDLNLNPFGGNVGIGTDKPGSKFVVAGTTEIKSDGTTWPALVFTNTTGKQKYFEMPPSGDMYLYDKQRGNYDIYFDNVGKVGIGTNNPQTKLHVEGSIFSSAGVSTNGRLTVDLTQNGSGPGGRDGLFLLSSPQNPFSSIITNTNTFYFYSTLRNGDANIQAGQGSFSIVEVRGGDVAEARHSTTGEQLPKGSVVVFDEKEKGKVRLTNKPYDRKVAGVISGAGKYYAGVTLLQEELQRGAIPVAQIGTVEVLTIGPVEVGDLLTTSEVEGYAKVATNMKKAFGSIIGKATTTLKKGERGLVEMQIEKH